MYANHPDILNFSKPSFYNCVNQGVFEFNPLDFPREKTLHIYKNPALNIVKVKPAGYLQELITYEDYN